MKNYKSNFEDFKNDKLVAKELKVIRGGDGGVPPANPDPIDPNEPKKGGGNGNP